MKKILFFTNALVGGGAEKVLVDLVNNLDKTKFDITVHVLDDNGIYRNSLNNNIKYKYLYKNKSYFMRRLKHFIFTRFIPARLVYNFFIADSYDIEVAFLEGFPTKLISCSNNVNKYAWVHTDLMNFYSGMNKIYKSIDEHGKVYKKFKKIFCVSESAETAFRERFGFDDNVFVQYNPVDNINVLKLSVETLSDIEIPECLKMIYVGRLTEEKGAKRLLNVVKKLSSEGFDFMLWMLGDGVLFNELNEFVIQNKLSNCVKILGFQNNPYKYLKAADLFVCPSFVEGYSTVAVEATILGIPTLTTECSGMREIFGESEYGMIVENSFNGLYNGIRKVLDDQSILSFYKEKASNRAKDYSISNTLAAFDKIFS